MENPAAAGTHPVGQQPQPVAQSSVNQPASPQSGNNRKKTGIFVVLAAVVLMLAVGVTIFLGQNENSPSFIQNNTGVPITADSVCSVGNTSTFLVIDRSVSMTHQVNGVKKMQLAKQAAGTFVDVMASEATNMIGVAGFFKNGGVTQGLTGNFDSVRSAINGLNPNGVNGTCLVCALDEVNKQFQASTSPNKKFIIILSDGLINRGEPNTDVNDVKKARTKAQTAIMAGKNMGISYYFVGIGTSKTNDGNTWLQSMATASGGKYIYAGEGDQLLAAYQEISKELGSGTVSGTVFNDINGNGVQDPGEPPLANWKVLLSNDGVVAAPNGPTASPTTNPTVSPTAALPTATGQITPTTAAATNTPTVAVATSTPTTIPTATPTSSASSSAQSNGNTLVQAKKNNNSNKNNNNKNNNNKNNNKGKNNKGKNNNNNKNNGKNGNNNGNGSNGGGNAPLPSGVGTSGNGNETLVAITDANGHYQFTGRCNGNYIISLNLEPGWSITVPVGNRYNVPLTPGTVVTDKNFGAKQAGQPTATPTPTGGGGAAVQLKVTVFMHGIGRAGDNPNPFPIQCGGPGTGTTVLDVHETRCLSNQNPLTPNRPMSVELINTSNVTVASGTGTLVYNAGAGNFSGTVGISAQLPPGSYSVKISSEKYLTKLYPSAITIKPGENTLPVISMIVGDVYTGEDSKNRLDMRDYNLIIGCYTSPTMAAKDCNIISNQKFLTDLNDDGVVNDADYNLFIRELSVQYGD